MRRRAGRLYVISSPSGGGKTTVVRELGRTSPGLVRSVSVTTRAPRSGERAGREYQFVSPAAFERLKRAGRLLEWARVHGAWYGTPRRPVAAALARGRDVVLSIDVQGAKKIRRAFGARATLVFLLPPSMAELRRRLVSRRTETSATIRRRMAVARRELASINAYEYFIVNDRIGEAAGRLRAVIRAQRRPGAR
ncbi:MAG TPA: guanylate kinase [bacterium]